MNVGTNHSSFDYVFVGGGLQTGLMTAAILHHQPSARIAIIERDSQLAGNHTWSFHESDISPSCHTWFTPFVETQWPAYDVIIGNLRRTVQLGYVSMSSQHFRQAIGHLADSHDVAILTGSAANLVTTDEVYLENGQRLEACVVFDNRGPEQLNLQTFEGGFQKFWGFEVELPSDWPSTRPVIMDDRIEQSDGFRFLYTLPFEPRRVLIEDTRFSNDPSLDRGNCLAEVTSYLTHHGFRQWHICREEHGILPMPTQGFLPGSSLPKLAGGYRGGWFHAATGYSFPFAIELAELVATVPADRLAASLRHFSSQHARRASFARFLNRLLFDLVKPEKRYQIFRRFYCVLSEPRLSRFYRHQFNTIDAFRIVVGLPPGGLQPRNFFRSLVSSYSPRSPQSDSVSAKRVLT